MKGKKLNVNEFGRRLKDEFGVDCRVLEEIDGEREVYEIENCMGFDFYTYDFTIKVELVEEDDDIVSYYVLEDYIKKSNSYTISSDFENWLNENDIDFNRTDAKTTSSIYFEVGCGEDETLKVRVADHCGNWVGNGSPDLWLNCGSMHPDADASNLEELIELVENRVK